MKANTEQGIFISYRRSDCQSQANALYDGLKNRLHGTRVFKDIDSIPPGADFEEHIRNEISHCHVALIMIGDNWLDARPGETIRRLDEPNDFVRLEVESALASKKCLVIPVLVEGMTMPASHELPESIQRLGRLNAFELSDQRWTVDIDRLADELRKISPGATAQQQATSPAASVPGYHSGQHQTRPLTSPAAPAPSAPSSTGRRASTPEPAKESIKGLVLLSVLTMGLGAWAVPLKLASRRAHDQAFRDQMKKFAIALGALAVLGFALITAAPTNSEGESTGPLSGIGALLVMAAIGGGVALAMKHRTTPAALPGTQAMLERRAKREEYRKLVQSDRPLAASMWVGRPDMQRDYDDGGLLDLNSLTTNDLVHHGGLSWEEASQIVDVRRKIGRFVDMHEVLAYANLSETTVVRLKDVAVFV